MFAEGNVQASRERLNVPLSSADIETLHAYLKFCEDFRLQAYNDSNLHPTVGVGFNLDRSDARALLKSVGADYDRVRDGAQYKPPPNAACLTVAQGEQLLAITADEAIKVAQSIFPGLDSCDATRQIILIALCFNLGAGRIQGFQRLIAAVAKRDWDTAADELVDSLWYMQIGHRGPRDANALRVGVMPPIVPRQPVCTLP
jgi:GH24 family phage-related lysozyme (muramidase)